MIINTTQTLLSPLIRNEGIYLFSTIQYTIYMLLKGNVHQSFKNEYVTFSVH